MTTASTRDTSRGGSDLLHDRYRLGDVIGRGGMADVRRAHDEVLGRDVAVKVFKPHVEDVDRTQSEIRLLAGLNHPGLVSLHDTGTTDDGTPWIVMELVDGPTLRECCQDGSLSLTRVAALGADVAEALAHCHDRGVIHRDIKPANVLLTADDRAKLADFGIARLVDGARHTAVGLTVGTAPYFSPEQVRGSALGPASDVYSLGLVLLECLTGVREYVDTNPVACAVARLHRAPTVPSDLPPAMSELLRAMTADDPATRPTAGAVAQALRAMALGGATEEAPEGEPGLGVPSGGVPIDATRVLTTAVPTTSPDDLPTTAAPAAPLAPAAPGPSLTTPPTDAEGTRRRESVGWPLWMRRSARSLRDDPAGQIMAVVLALVLLLLVVVGAWQATGGDAPGASGDTPIERLEDSVRR